MFGLDEAKIQSFIRSSASRNRSHWQTSFRLSPPTI
jgi:hypothetical protein